MIVNFKIRNILSIRSEQCLSFEPTSDTFTTVASQKATPVKNQASTGTCWCFATTSFMESELLRMTYS